MSTIPSDLADKLDERLRAHQVEELLQLAQRYGVAMEVNGVPVLAVPVVDLIEPALCEALDDSPLWRLFPADAAGSWRPERAG